MLTKYIRAFERVQAVLEYADKKYEVYRDLEVLEEVVHKFTPKKPIFKSEEIGFWYECPRCHSEVEYGEKMCTECDQSLDWDSENE